MSNATVVPQLQSAVNALVAGQVTQAQINNIVALTNQLVADAVTNFGPVIVTGTFGTQNVALGDWSLAGGSGSRTGVGANGAFAWGQGAEADGGGAVAFGRNSRANYTDTFAFGQGCRADADNGRSAGWACWSYGNQGYAHGYQASDRGIAGLEAYSHGSFGTDTEGLGTASAQTARAVLRA